jgi:hypothetical protein
MRTIKTLPRVSRAVNRPSRTRVALLKRLAAYKHVDPDVAYQALVQKLRTR